MDINEIRAPKRDDTQMVPQTIEGKEGLVVVDTTWGEIQPLQIGNDIRTVDEIEVHRFQENGFPIIDARTADFFDVSTIPGAENLPYDEIVHHLDQLNRDQPTIFFCNGPQCPQSRWAIQKLLDAGYPASGILYYRGGMHNWVTMGLPLSNNQITKR